MVLVVPLASFVIKRGPENTRRCIKNRVENTSHEAKLKSFLIRDDFLGLWQFCELWRPEFCRNVMCREAFWGLGCRDPG